MRSDALNLLGVYGLEISESLTFLILVLDEDVHVDTDGLFWLFVRLTSQLESIKPFWVRAPFTRDHIELTQRIARLLLVIKVLSIVSFCKRLMMSDEDLINSLGTELATLNTEIRCYDRLLGFNDILPFGSSGNDYSDSDSDTDPDGPGAPSRRTMVSTACRHTGSHIGQLPLIRPRQEVSDEDESEQSEICSGC